MKLQYLLVLACLSRVVYAENIKVAVGISLPPYVIQEKNAGREFDIVNQALANAGYTMKPVYLPFGRVPAALQHGEVDAAMTINEAMGIKNLFFSESHISYENVAISLGKNHLKIDDIEDIGAYSIVAFQNAKLYLGDAFKKMAEHNPRYNEYAQQVQQNSMLYAGRVQVVVADRHIFTYYNQEAKKRGATINQEVIFHDIFPKTPYKVGFRKKTHRDAFNAALAEMRLRGDYDAIISNY